MPSNLQIILVAGVSVFFLIILYLFFRPLFTRKLIQNPLDSSQSMLFADEAEQGNLSFESEKHLIQDQELIILWGKVTGKPPAEMWSGNKKI